MSANFTVKLIDKLTGPARAMERALKSMRAAETAVQRTSAATQAVVAATGRAYESAGARALRGSRMFDQASRTMRRASMAGRLGFAAPSATRHGAAGWFKGGGLITGPQYGPVLDREAQGFSLAQRVSHAFGDGARGIMRWNSAMGGALGKWSEMAGAMRGTPIFAALSALGSGLGKFLGFVKDGIFTFTKFGAIIGAVAAGAFTKATLQMAAFGESAKRALSYITGSDALGIREWHKAVDLSSKLGTNVEDTVSSYSKLRSMQFSASEATGLIKLSTDLKAITGDAQAAERAITAMTQIKAKSRLQSEELVGQLAEAGVSTMLVYSQLEKMLGTNRQGVLKKLQAGAIDSDTGLVAITRALKQKYHVSEFGKISAGYANQTLGGAWEALKTAPSRMFLRIGESIDKGPIMKALRTVRSAIEGAFSSGNGARFVNTMTAGLSKLVPVVTSFFEGFGSGLDSISKALTFGSSANVASWAKEAGRGVAEYFGKLIDLAKKAIPIMAEAASKIIKGLDINRVLDEISKFNWKAFGSNLVSIAGALGSIVSLLGPAAKAIRVVTEQGILNLGPPTSATLSATNASQMVERAAKPVESLSWWDSFVRNQVDAARYEGAMPRLEPSANVPNVRGGDDNRTVNVTVQVPEGAGAAAEDYARETAKRLRREMSMMLESARQST